jgi:[acyl-carrier-protein] S-malonyltransferase
VTGIAILCSGQGAQDAAMFDLLADAPAAAPVFEAAKAVLGGADPRDLVRQQSSAAIHADRLGQILCCTQTLAAWAVIGELVARPVLVAGYSIGELGAWGVAGLFDAAALLGLAAQRATAMDEATTAPSGLAAVRGLTRARLEPICRAHGCFIAIINGPDQMLVGGTRAALAPLLQDCTAAGAERTTLLPVAVASHTPLLAAASDRFARVLDAAPTSAALPSGVRLLSGIDAAPVLDIAAGKAKLARQIQQTVDWAACMDACQAAGIGKVIELGPGSALCRIARDALPGVDAHSVFDFHALAGFVAWVKR